MLWRRLRARIGSPSPAERLEAACQAVQADPGLIDLPVRLSVFGPSRLPADQVRALVALAAGREVHLWLADPSPGLWPRLAGGSPSALRAPDESAAQVEHPLLRSLGRDARELGIAADAHWSRTAAADEHLASIDPPATPKALLTRLQADLSADRPPAGADGPAPLDPGDRSVQVHGCHGAARQVEVLREAILTLLADDPTLQPRDILVMCPDLTTFGPLLAAAFTATGPGTPLADLRVRIADRSPEQDNEVLTTLGVALDLISGRVLRSELLDLVARAPVRTRFRLSEDHIERIESLSEAVGVRWGLDAQTRADFGLTGIETGTWRWALDRLLLGVALSEDVLPIVDGVLPYDDVTTTDVAPVGALAEVVGRLAVLRDAAKIRAPLPTWIGILSDAVTGLMDARGPDSWQLPHALAALGRTRPDDGPPRRGGSRARPRLWPTSAGCCRPARRTPTRSNFRSGGLTVCGLLPMRSVPHRVICLVGLDDGAFPRSPVPDGDDVLARRPCVGERDPRSEDRQVLLDAIMAATDHLVMTYTAADDRTNAPSPPCVPLGELLDALDATAALADGRRVREQVVHRHPLQPFDQRNFLPGTAGGRPFSHDKVALAGALVALEPRVPRPPAAPEAPLPPQPITEVDLSVLTDFLAAPSAAFLRRRIGVPPSKPRELASESIPIGLDGLGAWKVGNRILDLMGRAGQSAAAIARAERARGALPPGQLGRETLDAVGLKAAGGGRLRRRGPGGRAGSARGRRARAAVGSPGLRQRRRDPRHHAGPGHVLQSRRAAADPPLAGPARGGRQRPRPAVPCDRRRQGRGRASRGTDRPGGRPDPRRAAGPDGGGAAHPAAAVLTDVPRIRAMPPRGQKARSVPRHRGPRLATGQVRRGLRCGRGGGPVRPEGADRHPVRRCPAAGGGLVARRADAVRAAQPTAVGPDPRRRRARDGRAGGGAQGGAPVMTSAPVQVFDPTGPLPTGTTLLEASAGTGKTHTIASLAARYVAEGIVTVDQLLMITFGRNATRELRERVRETLTATRDTLLAADPEHHADPVVRMLARTPGAQVAAERLALALADFDAATIATTHQFCQQSLAGLGIAADRDPGEEFVEDIKPIVDEAIDDLYVAMYRQPRPGLAQLSLADAREIGRAAVFDPQADLDVGPTQPDSAEDVRVRFARAVRNRVLARRRAQHLVTFDDLVLRLAATLTDPVSGEVACQRLRHRYRVVLVDEFQDTDPAQWQIVRSAFHGHRTVILIGDPKQAIYAFRGADVYSYLDAVEVADHRATLTTNWRSDAAVVDGIGELLGASELGDPRIVVRPIAANRPGSRLHGLPGDARVRLRQIRQTGPDKPPAVGDVRRHICADVAADVVDLLSGTARLLVEQPDGQPPVSRALVPGDIAVLVATNPQADLAREALTAAGVPAVMGGTTSIFSTRAAIQWRDLLRALESPRGRTIRPAALTDFFGYSATDLAVDGEVIDERVAARLRDWSRVLAERDMAALVAVIDAESGLTARVLAHPDGERTMTDLRQLAGELTVQQRETRWGATALLDWLEMQSQRTAEDGREQTMARTRRLESDADAVQIITIHRAKGLEFPVTYVPFGWDRPVFSEKTITSHVGARRVLDVRPPKSDAVRPSVQVAREEERGESLRLLYVALTRASSLVVAHWAPSPQNTETAPLHRLLAPGPPTRSGPSRAIR